MAQRVDLIQIKNQLGLALKSNAKVYWETLRKFTQAKISKAELDRSTKALLGSKYLPLHNLFVLSIIRNAHAALPSGRRPPLPAKSVLSSSRQTQKRTFPDDGQVLSERRMAMLRKLKRPRYVFRPPLKRPTPPPARDRPLLSSVAAAAAHFADSGLGGLVSPDHKFGLPELVALRNRMCRVANESGIKVVSNSAVLLMMFALEEHLKNVYIHCTHTPRKLVKGSISSQQTSTTLFHPEPMHDQDPTLSTRDILTGIQVNQDILGESLSLHRELVAFRCQQPNNITK